MESIILPKWPTLIVVGKPVSKEQAQEILIRTGSVYFGCNDRAWEAQVAEAIGLAPDKSESNWVSYSWYNANMEPYGVFDLEYLTNERVASCWIGGPKGWCDWNGNIGCNTYNIGKWPNYEEVLREWTLIAETFPFLDLECQLLDGESCEDNATPLVQFSIANGKVASFVPVKKLMETSDIVESTISNRFTNPYAERGCTIEQFKDALEVTRKAVSKQ